MREKFTEIQLGEIPPNVCEICKLGGEVEQGRLMVYCDHCLLLAHVGCTLKSLENCNSETIKCGTCNRRTRIRYDKRNSTRLLSSLYYLLKRTLSILIWTPVVLGLITLIGYVLRISLTTRQPDDLTYWQPTSTDFLIGLVLVPILVFVVSIIRSRIARRFFCYCCVWCQNSRRVVRRYR